MTRRKQISALLLACALAVRGQGIASYKDLMKEGDQLAAKHQWEDALEKYRAAIGRDSDPQRTAFAAFKMAAMYEKRDNPVNALDWYQTSEASAPFPETEAAIKRLQAALSTHIATAEEIKRGLIATGRTQRVTPSLNIYVNFDLDKDTLTNAGEAQVAELAKALKDPAFAENRFAIVGHTDKRGTPEHNQDLSERRARRVLEVLHREFDFESSRFDVVGMGKRELLRTGDSEEDHQVNRRVEIRKLSAG